MVLRKNNPQVSTILLLKQIIFHSNDTTVPARRCLSAPEAPQSIRDDNNDSDFTPELAAFYESDAGGGLEEIEHNGRKGNRNDSPTSPSSNDLSKCDEKSKRTFSATLDDSAEEEKKVEIDLE